MPVTMIPRLVLVLAVLAGLTVLPANAQETTATGTAETTSAATLTEGDLPDLLSDRAVVLATWNGGAFTNHDLTSTLRFRKPQSMAEMDERQILYMPRNRLAGVVSDLVYEQLLYERAVKDGVTSALPEIRKKLDEFDYNTLAKVYYDKVFTPRIQKLQDADLLERYEADKDTRHTVPENWLVQELFLSGYELHEVKEGETLESIARDISGTADAAARILRADALHYFRKAPGEAQGKSITHPLKPGEQLFVPVSRDDETSKAALAADLLKKARAGEDFTRIVEEHTDVPGGNRAAAFVPDFHLMHAPLAEFIRNGKTNDVSDVIRGPHGLHILKVVDHQTTTVRPFDEVKGRMLVPADSESVYAELVRKEVLDELREKYGVKVDTELLKRDTIDGEKPVAGDTPLVTGTDFVYTVDEFRKDLAPTMRGWDGMTFQERQELVRTAPEVVKHLIGLDARAMKLDESPEFREALQSKALMEVVAEYMRRESARRPEPTEADYREYHRKNIDRYTEAGKVTLREITKRVNPSQPPAARAKAVENARAELASIRGQIRTAEDFEQMARRESQSIATRSRGGLIGTVPADFRGPTVKNVIDQLDPGQVSEPFLYGAEVMILMMDAETPPTPKPYEEVAGRVKNDYARDVPRRQQQDRRAKLLEEAGFELKF